MKATPARGWNMGRTGEPVVDPVGLSAAQLLGDACVVCRKKWPRPRVRVGRLPDSSGVFAMRRLRTRPVYTARGGASAARTPGGLLEATLTKAAGLASVVVEVSPGRRVTRAFGEVRDHPAGAPGWGRPGAPERPLAPTVYGLACGFTDCGRVASIHTLVHSA